MGYYRGVTTRKHRSKRERMAELEREMREQNRGKVQGRRWLKQEPAR